MSKKFKKFIKEYGRLKQADSLESVLCLSVLISQKVLKPDSSINDANNYFSDLNKESCGDCPFFSTCLACIINE